MEKEEIIKLYKKYIDKKRLNLITSLTIISFLLTGSAYLVNKDRSNSKDKVYNSEVFTYNDYYNTVNHHYEDMDKQDSDILLIRKVSPWIIDGIEARRSIKEYRVKDITFDKLIFKGNYKKVISNIEYENVMEYKYKNELRDYDRYEEDYFEVIDINQSEDDCKEVVRPVSKETILYLLSELVIYLFVLNMNEGPLYESILTDIYEINECKDKIRKLAK